MSDQTEAPAPPQPRRIVEPLPGCDPAIDRWRSALENARRRMLAVVEAMDEFRRVEQRRYWYAEPYETTAETVVHPLMQHEAQQRGHIHVFSDWAAQHG